MIVYVWVPHIEQNVKITTKKNTTVKDVINMVCKYVNKRSPWLHIEPETRNLYHWYDNRYFID